MQNISDLRSYQENYRRDKFGKKILDIIPELNPYVHHRLYIATELGIIPKNMYVDSDIVDDAILSLFERNLDEFTSSQDLKLEMFKLVIAKLDQIFASESWHQKSMSTDKLLHQELNDLRERFTFDGDQDSVMNEELADISYHQKDFTVPLKLYEDKQHSVISAFDSKIWDQPDKNFIVKTTKTLSLNASNIIDLYVFGNLKIDEIATIKGKSIQEIQDIIKQVKGNVGDVLENNNR